MLRKKMKIPKKINIIKHMKNYPFDFVSKKVALTHFFDWVETCLGDRKSSSNETLHLCEDWEYDDCLTSLQLSWETEELNPKYKQQQIKYEAFLEKQKQKTIENVKRNLLRKVY